MSVVSDVHTLGLKVFVNVSSPIERSVATKHSFQRALSLTTAFEFSEHFKCIRIGLQLDGKSF